MHYLKEDLASWKVTVVCTTHVMNNLMLFDQVVVIAGQTVVYSGPPQRLLVHFKVVGYAELYEKLETWPSRTVEGKVAPVSGPHVGVTNGVLDPKHLVP